MKALIGTEKQIAWATSIRAKYVAWMNDGNETSGWWHREEAVRKLLGSTNYDARIKAAKSAYPREDRESRKAARAAEIEKMTAEAFSIIENEASAAWWIDQR